MVLRRFATVALGLFAATFATSPIARAFTVKTTRTGVPVHWDNHIEFVSALSPAPAQVSATASREAIDAAALTWQVALGGAGLEIAQSATAVAAAAHDHDGINMIRWAVDRDDPDIEPGVVALTFVSYRVTDGVIEDADIVVNAVDFRWATEMAGCKTAFDLESALTHELGHALGLAHSAHPDATMFATGQGCETHKRDLASDDQAGVVALYPASVEAGGCSTAGGGGGAGGVGSLAVLAIVALVARRRRGMAAAVAVAGAFGLASPAEASQLRRLAFAELGDGAALVVRGQVMAVTASRDGALESHSDIAVNECLSGDCPATVRVVRRGGERDGVGLWVDGEAAPEVGTEVVIYLRSDKRGRLHVLGGVQGLLRVVATSQGVFAVRDLRGHHVLVDGAWQPGRVEAIGVEALARSLARTASPTEPPVQRR